MGLVHQHNFLTLVDIVRLYSHRVKANRKTKMLGWLKDLFAIMIFAFILPSNKKYNMLRFIESDPSLYSNNNAGMPVMMQIIQNFKGCK